MRLPNGICGSVIIDEAATLEFTLLVSSADLVIRGLPAGRIVAKLNGCLASRKAYDQAHEVHFMEC